MRIWDLPPEELCREHLLGEHVEAHAIWSIITKRMKGYSNHPEVLRWKGKLAALYTRHEEIAAEMARRGYVHRSSLDKKLATGSHFQREKVDTVEEQRRLLRLKGCGCSLRWDSGDRLHRNPGPRSLHDKDIRRGIANHG